MSEGPVPEPQGVFKTSAQKVTEYRLEVLTRAYCEGTYGGEVFLRLEALANCKADLWLITKALGEGCTLELAVRIFT